MLPGGLSHFGQVCLQEYGAPTKQTCPSPSKSMGDQVQDPLKSPLQALALGSQGTVNYIGPNSRVLATVHSLQFLHLSP